MSKSHSIPLESFASIFAFTFFRICTDIAIGFRNTFPLLLEYRQRINFGNSVANTSRQGIINKARTA